MKSCCKAIKSLLLDINACGINRVVIFLDFAIFVAKTSKGSFPLKTIMTLGFKFDKIFVKLVEKHQHIPTKDL